MILDDVIEIKNADPDSQYRLVPCKCGSDNVAYVHYNGRGGAKWRVECFDCGHTVDKGCRVRHDAQIAWNGLVQAERYRMYKPFTPNNKADRKRNKPFQGAHKKGKAKK